MSNQTVQALSASFGISFALLKQFIKVCPADLWQEKFGGWPVWQQVYHAIGAIDFFTLGANLPSSESPLANAVGGLEVQGEKGLNQVEMETFASKMEEKGKAFFNLLSDDQLAQKNIPLSEAMGNETTNATALAMMAAHTLYHLGSCDAALRQRGLKGVF